jgi:hypothetical protein
MFNWLKRRASDVAGSPAAGVTRGLQGDGWHGRLDLTPQVGGAQEDRALRHAARHGRPDDGGAAAGRGEA